MLFRSESNRPRRLLGASTPVAREIQFHDMTLRDGVMRMRPITDGIVVPPHDRVVFESGGQHLMLIGLQVPLSAGRSVPLTLRFDRDSELTTSLRIVSIDDTTPASKK